MKEYSNQTIYIRESHGENYTYTVIANSLINDERLNVTEIGLMTKFLSKGKNYIFNSTYEQKTSGIGKLYYNACLQKLKEYGYIVKKNLITGGIKWVIIESKEIIQDLQTIGYLQWNYTKKCWMIDESKFTTFQLTDFHHIANIENMEIENMEIENMEIENMEIENMEINPLLSTNTPSTKEPIKDEKSKEEINKDEPLVREKILENDFQEIITISTPNEVKLNEVVKDESLTHNPIKNDFDLVYNSIEYFQRIVANANWKKESIKNHSNAFIAMNVFNYNNSNEQEKEEMIKKDKTISLQHYLTKFACKLPDSQLKKEYERECTVNDKQELMYN